MAGELRRRLPGRWPALSDWFEDFPFEMRVTPEPHPIRIEESREDDGYVVRAELPGVDPDKDIEITVEDDVLTVHAERREEKREKRLSEFHYGSFTRSVRLPAGSSEEDITASYHDGVLTVRAPLPRESAKVKRHIEVARGDESAA